MHAQVSAKSLKNIITSKLSILLYIADGFWSSCSSWTSSMFACDTNDGLRVRERQCDNPIPTYGQCPGHDMDEIEGAVFYDYLHQFTCQFLTLYLINERSWMLESLDYMVYIWVYHGELWTRKQNTNKILLIRTGYRLCAECWWGLLR